MQILGWLHVALILITRVEYTLFWLERKGKGVNKIDKTCHYENFIDKISLFTKRTSKELRFSIFSLRIVGTSKVSVFPEIFLLRLSNFPEFFGFLSLC